MAYQNPILSEENEFFDDNDAADDFDDAELPDTSSSFERQLVPAVDTVSVPTTSTAGASSGGGGAGGSTTPTKKKHYFLKELRCMMYGFGDKKVPYTESVELVEQLVIEYIRRVTCRAMEVGKPGRMQLEDIWYLIRRDPRKHGRVKELLQMNEELRKARKAFDEAKYGDLEAQKDKAKKAE